MDDFQKSVAKTCLDGAEGNSLTFPQIVETLMRAGFESYLIDFRRSVAIYYLPDGQSVELPTQQVRTAIAPGFDAASMQAAIREAQQLVPGYTYAGFCQRAAAAGCAGYIVSFPGRRALYFGRSAEVHVEHVPA
ncbi:DUF1398 domain-containing protein [Humitalea sp. 24SJ18S-53]|uniref:DUF1398 domain-containing protein n=1 Tax=Humitalea sp. 24SJ18S-53 TaxID=3422307 RepID=UPI003D675D76